MEGENMSVEVSDSIWEPHTTSMDEDIARHVLNM